MLEWHMNLIIVGKNMKYEEQKYPYLMPRG